MKAPNGEKTNLTEAQWVSVRTTNFKKWFGDWERAAQFKAAMGKIMSMKPVAAISGNEFQKDGTPLTEKVTKFWKERFGGAAISPELGEVKLDIEGVKSSIGHGIGSLKAAAFACVADVIRKGIVFDRQKNWKKRGYDTAVIAAPVTIKGAEYICEIVVTQRANKQGFYLHEVEIKKKLEDVFKTSTEGGTPQASRSILARRAEDIKREEEEISKVVDENGEPMVVYHGSYADFKEFDVSLAGKNFGTEEEDAGFIFTTSSRETAENYSEWTLEFENERRIAYGDEALPDESARNYELFVNLENPLIYDLKDNPFGVFREGDAIEPKIWDDPVFHRKALKEFAEGDKDGYDYDGIILKGEESVWVLATEPGQIKSATENRGTYSSRNADITLSVVTYGQWARQALRRRPDELVAGKVLKRFDKWLKRFDTAVGSTNKTLGTGAARLGVIAGLMEATRSVLPPQYQFGRLNVLMSWAAVYAELAETGEVPKSGGVLKGPIFDKFINALEARRDMGMTEQELRDTLASLGAVKLEEALKKVARGCREQLDRFIKDRAREQIENLWKRAYPDKTEKGARKKGKMHAHNYRLAADMVGWMDKTADEVNRALQAIQTELAAPNTTQERADELRTEMGILQTFGAWESLDAEAAEKALDAFRGFIGSGWTEWDMKEEERKARARRKTRRSMLFFDRLSVMPRHYRNKKCFT